MKLRAMMSCSLAVFELFAVSCGSESTGSGPVTPPVPQLATLELTPSQRLSLFVGDSVTIQCVARDKDGRVMPTAEITFSSSLNSVASVSPTGRVVGLGAGSTVITAQSGSVMATNTVAVAGLSTVADARVASLSLDIGQDVPLTVTVLNPKGTVLGGIPAKYVVADPAIATVTPDGHVHGVGFGQTTVAVTVDTVTRTASIRVAPWPQEPDAFSKVTERTFSKLATTANDTAGIDGWDAHEEYSWPNISIVSDPTAPRSPPNVLQALYPAGTQGGTDSATPGRLLRALPDLTQRVYVSVWVKLSANWHAHQTGTNKVLFIWLKNLPRFFLSAEGPDASALKPTGRLQGTPEDILRHREQLFPNVNATRVIPGVWQRWELVVKANTPGLRNGEFHLWIDGIETANYTDVAYLDANETGAWNLVDIEPIWGGGGDVVTTAQMMLFDHIYVSRK